jgi:hypothetical protein
VHEVVQLLLLLPVLAVLAAAIETIQAVIFILATISAFLVQHAARHGCRRVSQHLDDTAARSNRSRLTRCANKSEGFYTIFCLYYGCLALIQYDETPKQHREI